MDLKSYRVSSYMHVWNAVYLDNTWKHLDLTWDDPVASDNRDYLEHDYFLIDTNSLIKKEKTQHMFNQEIYSELKEA